MPALTLVAPDISCDHCKRAIETELPALPGVGHVQVEIPTKTVRLVYDAALTGESTIRARLGEIGYPAAS